MLQQLQPVVLTSSTAINIQRVNDVGVINYAKKGNKKLQNIIKCIQKDKDNDYLSRVISIPDEDTYVDQLENCSN